MSKPKKYRLYALPATEETVRKAEKARFSRITVDYVLIYKIGRMDNAVEITESEAHRLTEAERQWLQDCNLALIAEKTKDNMSGILMSLSQKVDALEKALAAQKLKEEGAANG